MEIPTSKFTDGINTRIKLIIRQNYGLKNIDLTQEKLWMRSGWVPTALSRLSPKAMTMEVRQARPKLVPLSN